MKKFLCILSFVFCIGATFAYTSDDLANANSLADQQIIMEQTIASKYGLDNKILRQEVIGMALKVKGITLPENYTCKKYFADATKNDWICRAVELAADNGIITRNKYANPGKYVTRAEAFSMIYSASGITPFRELAGFQVLDKDATLWQKDLFQKIHDSEISMPGEKYITSDTPAIPVYFYPNRLATRAEVFHFSASTIRIRLELPSPEIDILYDTSKDSRNWITQTPTQDAGFILYSLIPEGDTLTDWKEKNG